MDEIPVSPSPIQDSNIPPQAVAPAPQPSHKIPLLIAGLVLLLGTIFGGLYLVKSSVKEVACTMEAKLCPDGSSVGRTGPNCEFALCPTLSDQTANWKTYTNTKHRYSLKYVPHPGLKGFGCSMRTSGEKGEETFALDEVSSSFPECAFGGYAWPISVSVEQTKPDCVNQDQAGYTVSRSEIVVDGMPAIKCDKIYTGVYNPNPEHIKGPTRITEVSVPKPNQYFRLILTNFNYQETFNQILSTFKFLEENDYVMGIQLVSCCSCPTKITKELVGRDGWVEYKNGRDYSNQRPTTCGKIACKPCPPID